MRRQIAIVMYSAVFGLMALSSNAMAQQKTVAACQAEWRANKAANQANGVTEKAYVAQCRGGAAPAQTTTAPSAPTATAAQSASGQKTAKACREEWRANKAANQASGVTESAYVAQCRGGAAPAQTTAAPAAPSAPTAAAAQPASGQKTAKACREEWRAKRPPIKQRRDRKCLRRPMSRRRCAGSDHYGSGSTVGFCSCSSAGSRANRSCSFGPASFPANLDYQSGSHHCGKSHRGERIFKRGAG